MKAQRYHVIWKKPIRVYQQGSRGLWASFEVDPTKAALIKKPMPRKPRTLVFENWIGKDGKHYCHLRSGREILMPAEGYERIRQVERLYEIITTRTKENTRYVTLSEPYSPKKRK